MKEVKSLSMLRNPSKLAKAIALSCFVFVGTAEVRGALFDDFSSGYVEGDISGQTGGAGWETDSSWIALGTPTLGHAFNVDEANGDWRLQVFSISEHDDMEQSAVSRPYVRPDRAPYSFLFEIELVDFDAQPGTWISLMDNRASNHSLGGNATWIIMARDPLMNENGDHVWAVHDGTGGGSFEGATLTDVVLEPGGVYQFEVELLGGNQYRVHIDNGSEVYSTEPLGFRRDTDDGWPNRIPHFSMRSAAQNNATAFNVLNIETLGEDNGTEVWGVPTAGNERRFLRIRSEFNHVP